MAEAKAGAEELTDQLFDAIDEGTAGKVDAALAAGASLEASKDGFKALVFACRIKSKDMVEYLLSKKADVNAVSDDDDKYSALRMATAMKSLDILKVLVDAGADLEGKSASGATALHLATGDGSEEVTKALLEAKASVATTDADGNTALLSAAGSGSSEVVALLLKARASLEAKNAAGQDAFKVAEAAESKAAVALLHQQVALLAEEAAEAERQRLEFEKKQNKEAVHRLTRVKPLAEWTQSECALFFRTNPTITSEFVTLAENSPKLNGALLASPFLTKYLLEEMGCKPSDGQLALTATQDLIALQAERKRREKKRKCTIM